MIGSKRFEASDGSPARGMARLAGAAVVLALVGAALATPVAGQQAPATPGLPWQTPVLSRVPAPEWLSLGGELRLRTEHRSGIGFSPDASDTYTLIRTRMDVGIQPTRTLRIGLQAQDSRSPGLANANGVFRDPMDLRQAYVQAGDPNDGPFLVTLGRQLLAYGDQRLIGALDWTNTSRSFDAVRLRVRGARAEVDVFASSVVRNDPTRRLNRSDFGSGFYGVYARIRTGLEALVLEPFALLKTSPAVAGGSSGADRYSTGLRVVAESGAWSSTFMFVEQRGTVGESNISARTVSAYSSYTLPLGGAPRIYAEYDYATGDSDPSDGTAGAFEDMFPTAHLYYGYNDLVGLRNIENVRLGIRARVMGRLDVGADIHAFWLATRHDNLFNAGGGLAVAAPEGGAEARRVGEEIDVTFGLPLGETMLLSGGLGHLFPGPFLEEATEAEGHTFSQLSLSVRF